MLSLFPIVMVGIDPLVVIAPSESSEPPPLTPVVGFESLSSELWPSTAVAAEAALSAPLRVLKGGGLDVRRRHDGEGSCSDWRDDTVFPGDGDGLRLPEKEKDDRLALAESRVGFGEGLDEMGAEDDGDDERFVELAPWFNV